MNPRIQDATTTTTTTAATATATRTASHRWYGVGRLGPWRLAPPPVPPLTLIPLSRGRSSARSSMTARGQPWGKKANARSRARYQMWTLGGRRETGGFVRGAVRGCGTHGYSDGRTSEDIAREEN
eukprot:14978-Pelagococcus_subviridis.AAC.5